MQGCGETMSSNRVALLTGIGPGLGASLARVLRAAAFYSGSLRDIPILSES
jgi:hypothetical protein